MALSPELRKVLLEGMHNLMCTPHCPSRDPARFVWVRELRPVRGGKDCICQGLSVRYNGEVVS